MRYLTIACLLLGPAIASAGVTNGDIETNATPQFGGITGWGPNGGWAPHACFAKPGNETLGASFGFMSAGGTETVGQKATDIIQAGVPYTFSGWAWPGGNTTGEIVFQIGYDDGGTFQPLATQAYNIDNIAAWAPLAGVTHTAAPGAPEVGKTLWVRIGDGIAGAPGNDDVWFDNLAVSVPEPASMLLLGLAAAGLARRRR